MCYVIAKGNSNKIINISDNIVLKRPKKKIKKIQKLLEMNFQIIRKFIIYGKRIKNYFQ